MRMQGNRFVHAVSTNDVQASLTTIRVRCVETGRRPLADEHSKGKSKAQFLSIFQMRLLDYLPRRFVILEIFRSGNPK